jgi:uncharacterized membrane protein YphA (DoxX/SURF4 family)
MAQSLTEMTGRTGATGSQANTSNGVLGVLAVDGASRTQLALTGAVIALIRITMGFFWFQESLLKLPGHTGFFKQLLQAVAHNAIIPMYAGMVQKIFVPHTTQFIFCVWILESLIALSLLFGLFARLGGLAGALWGALLFCGLAYPSGPGPGANPWYFGLIVLVNALLALTASGRSLGIDRWLRPVMLQRAAKGNRWARFVAALE